MPSSPVAIKPIELPYVTWSTRGWVSPVFPSLRCVPAQLTGVENKSLNPRCDVDASFVEFDFILEPRQKGTDVFRHGGFILRDVLGCKLRKCQASVQDVESTEILYGSREEFFLGLAVKSLRPGREDVRIVRFSV